MSIFSLLFHTVHHLKAKQIIYQVIYRFYNPSFIQRSQVGIPMSLAEGIDKYTCNNDMRFIFLNLSSDFKGWNDTSHGMLWAYNLNYMDWLLQPGMTYEKGAEWIDRFVAELPGNRIGLDQYPTALRGINWIKFISMHRESIGERSFKQWNDSLYSQYVLLSKKLEYHLLGNHLLEDVYSLFIAALYFKDYRFYRKSTRLLRQELEEQILPDGAHYEQSPMYHCILLDRLLDCYNFSFRNIRFAGQGTFNEYLKEKAVLMLGHLENIIYKDGSIPLLNDSANGIAPIPQMLQSYAQRLGLRWAEIPMKQCGYRKLQAGQMEAVVDVGNITATYQPGHTHADTFTYELRIGGQPVVIDTGISTYNKNERRQYERSTVAHNTVSAEGRNSSEVWGGFRVGRRAKVTLVHDTTDRIEAEHDGYGRPCRRIFLLTDDRLQIEDVIDTDAVSHIHLWKEEDIVSANHNEVITTHCRIEISNAVKVTVREEKVSTEYNRFCSIKVVDIQFRNNVVYSIAKR